MKNHKFTKGLSSREAASLLRQFGENELARSERKSFFIILVRQFSSPLILVLLAAAIISFAIGYLPDQEPHFVDTILIMAIVLISGVLGFIQDYNAEKTIEALQKMASPKARVIRDNKEQEIPASQVVPGDVLLVGAGDMITADGKVFEEFHLDLDESILTGESQAAHKRSNDLVFKNTVVTSGIGKVLVSSTGMSTKIGHVASELQNVEEERSSFQVELAVLSKKLSLITLFITILIGIVGIFKFGFYTAILTAISLAVAAIPEGLPAVVVLALALGAGRMFKKNALIRKLPIVESVGAVDIICTDKTGTLTLNEMTVTNVFYDDNEVDVSAIQKSDDLHETARLLFLCADTCNNASEGYNTDGSIRYFGDQTEIALKKTAQKILTGIDAPQFQKINELSFDSNRKRMTVAVKDETGGYLVFSKGAPEVLIDRCTHILNNGEVVTLNESGKLKLLQQTKEYASDALRVLGFAYKETNDPEKELEEGLIWIGLQAMIDPPRKEAKQALEDCQNAGIRVIMITGDNPITASAIAKQVGLSSGEVMTGEQIDKLGDEELEQRLMAGVNIFARTDPFHKLRLLEILEKEHTVAMTGDGVNDALAIRRAVVGIAMGKKGTEVAKQASDIVLLDDNFSSIRDAIKEGRTIFNNTRKFIDYLLTCNLAEVALIFFITFFFSFNEPILYPVQLLWINLLTDGLVALALGADPPVKDIMKQPPRKNREPLIDKKLAWLIGLIGIKKAIVLVITFVIVLPMGLDTARSTLLTGIVLFEFVRIGAIRYGEKIGWFDNKWLVAGLVGSLILQVGLIYSPWNHFFYLTPLGLFEWGVLIVGVIVGYLLAIGITKLVLKKFSHNVGVAVNQTLS